MPAAAYLPTPAEAPFDSRRSKDGIELIELPDVHSQSNNGLWDAVLQAYRGEGFQAGCASGARHVLATLIPAAESFLRTRPQASTELRAAIYGFIEHVERQNATASDDGSFVENGLGI